MFTEIVILTCFYCLFNTGFNHCMWSASLRFNRKEDEARSIILKQLVSHTSLQEGLSLRC